MVPIRIQVLFSSSPSDKRKLSPIKGFYLALQRLDLASHLVAAFLTSSTLVIPRRRGQPVFPLALRSFSLFSPLFSSMFWPCYQLECLDSVTFSELLFLSEFFSPYKLFKLKEQNFNIIPTFFNFPPRRQLQGTPHDYIVKEESLKWTPGATASLTLLSANASSISLCEKFCSNIFFGIPFFFGLCFFKNFTNLLSHLFNNLLVY